jgi:beta-glucuronidase
LAFSEETKPAAAVAVDLTGKSLGELVSLAWATSGNGDYAELDRIFDYGLKTYEQQAMSLHANLTGFPPREKIADYKVMNNVSTLHFIRAEALMHQGKTDDAIALFKEIMREYPYSQSWDPSRGAYWSIAEKSQASIDVMTGVEEQREAAEKNKPLVLPVLVKPGKDEVVDYKKYGHFVGVGTRDFHFEMGNPTPLADAVGEGIFPNTGDVLRNPQFRELYKEGRLTGSHWDFVNTKDLEAAYFKWATASESPGVKLFYTALVFERAGMFLEAIKAYHALVVHFPRTVGATYWQTAWYPAQAAVAKIKNILRLHPELGLVYKGGKVRVLNDTDPQKAIFIVDPGEIVPGKGIEIGGIMPRKALGRVKRCLGGKKTHLVQYRNGDWQMIVAGKPFIIKGLTYTPTKVGQSPDKGTLEPWMFQDTDHNGKIDSPYDSWVDKNHNNIQDSDEPVVGDFELLKEMGVNAIRLYHNNSKISKELLRDLFDRYGIRVIMGDYLGKYALGSGADWATGTDYENPEHRRKMMESVEAMVREFKDEPYILMWVLGNENNYGVASNADKKPDAYYKFVNEVAKRIKQIDPDRPVAICNGDTLFIEKLARYAPAIDMFGANVYRGDYGFGSFWDQVRYTVDRPAFITEYGAPAYSKKVSLEEAEEEQAQYHKGNWLDIMANSAGYSDGEGNAVGGIAFEWMDEWWKNYEPAKHDTKADVIGPFSGGYYFEEWFGIVGQGDGSKSPFLRQLRKAYFVYQDLWHR